MVFMRDTTRWLSRWTTDRRFPWWVVPARQPADSMRQRPRLAQHASAEEDSGGGFECLHQFRLNPDMNMNHVHGFPGEASSGFSGLMRMFLNWIFMGGPGCICRAMMPRVAA